MTRHCLLLLTWCCILPGRDADAQRSSGQTGFKIIPLGVKGGTDESNLSSYLLSARGSKAGICLDAGTIHYGIEKAIHSGAFSGTAGTILKNNIKGYCISHPHLDHVAGLIINAPDDTVKNIYALPFCIAVLKEKYFSWKSWANFGDEGEKPMLSKYHYQSLTPGTERSLEQTGLSVTAFPLSHAGAGQSTAFLVRNTDSYLLYLGDTGADTAEHSSSLRYLWQQITPLVKEKKLKAILIETSFSNEQPEKLLFGHLTPKLLMQEAGVLAGFTGAAALRDMPFIITHRKPSGNRESVIQKELLQLNAYHLRLIFPEQGKAIIL